MDIGIDLDLNNDIEVITILLHILEFQFEYKCWPYCIIMSLLMYVHKCMYYVHNIGLSNVDTPYFPEQYYIWIFMFLFDSWANYKNSAISYTSSKSWDYRVLCKNVSVSEVLLIKMGYL